ncbi:DUF6011 domain-containing protein [Rhodococcus gannanensis]|uniref:DUF6011 domain-containing protein n=1 Tax=Rhodococcus gannanensis TaxID=1960308 RepID=A0ABW4NZZ0_9NOCA
MLHPAFLVLFLPVFAAAMAVTVRGATLWYRYRNPRRPRKPRAKTARLARLPSRPARVLPLLASNCVICGRPLTNPQSMRARVGTTCIKKYGPRYATQPNPAYDEWEKLKAAAESDRVAEQARLDVEFQLALSGYSSLMLAWESEIASPAGQSRAANRQIGTRILCVGAVSTSVAIALATFSMYWIGIQ